MGWRKYDLILIQQADGTYTVEQNRRRLIDRLDEDEALAYAKQHRKPDERVVKIEKDGYESDMTRQLSRLRTRA